MKFTEAQLEQAFIDLLQEEQMTHLVGGEVRKMSFKAYQNHPHNTVISLLKKC